MTTFRTIQNVNGTVYNPAELTIVYAEDINALTTAVNTIEEVTDHFSYDEEGNFVACDVKFGVAEQIFSADGSFDIETFTGAPGHAFAGNLLTGIARVMIGPYEAMAGFVNGIVTYMSSFSGDFFVFNKLNVSGNFVPQAGIEYSVTREPVSAGADIISSPTRFFFAQTSDVFYIQGISDGIDGLAFTVINVGSSNLVVLNESPDASTGQKIKTRTGGSVTVAPNNSISFIYNAGDFYWYTF